MPLAPRYTWSETDDSVHIQLQGVAIKDASQLLCGDAVLKITAAPYFLLLDLHGDVDARSSVAKVCGSNLHVTLRKTAPGLWGRLTAKGDKAAIAARREASIRRAHAQQAADAEARAKRKAQEERDAVDRRIELDRQQRDAIEARRNQELAAERRQLEQWQGSLAGGGTAPKVAGVTAEEGDESDYEEEPLVVEEEESGETDELVQAAAPTAAVEADAGAAAAAAAAVKGERSRGEEQPADHPDYYGRGWRPSRDQGWRSSPGGIAGTPGNDGSSSESGSSGDGSGPGSPVGSEPAAAEVEGPEAVAGVGEAESGDAAASPEPLLSVPQPPLARGALPPVAVTFTPLETPHLPARQQREAELRLHKWDATAAQDISNDSIDLADRQPAFLKDKGDALFRQGNPRGAAAAYTRALALAAPRDAAPLLANRSACYSKLGEHAAAAADCSAALEVLCSCAAAATGAAGPVEEPLAGSTSAEPLLPLEGGDLKMAVKLLARRAAARVAQGDLAAAEVDLTKALRHDPSNERLAADLAEVRAAAELSALRTTTTANSSCTGARDPAAGGSTSAGVMTADGGANAPNAAAVVACGDGLSQAAAAAVVRARAEARFRAKDYEGAAEAFGALVQLYQQAEQPRDDAASADDADGSPPVGSGIDTSTSTAAAVARALGNRAACWLPLERYSDCIADCGTALGVLLHVMQGTAVVPPACDGKASAVAAAENLLAAAKQAAATAAGGSHGAQQQPLPAGGWSQVIPSGARLAARAALASACAKRAADAVTLFEAARALHRFVGEDAAAGRLSEDEARLLRCCLGLRRGKGVGEGAAEGCTLEQRGGVPVAAE